MEQFPNMRLTTQRRVILEELGKVTSHPTAIEVHDLVSRRLPRIGLNTVYRNLELMTASGIILKCEVGGTQKRFDAVVEPHYHIRCTACGRVDDIALEVQSRINQAAEEASKYIVLGHHIEFAGICTKCSGEEKEAVFNGRSKLPCSQQTKRRAEIYYDERATCPSFTTGGNGYVR